MTAALIIAAGKTDSRAGFAPEKQIGALNALERIVKTFRLAGIRRIVIVGDESALPQKLLPPMELVYLTAPAGGEMLASVKLGLEYLQGKCSAALITHADIPLFSVQSVKLLLGGKANVRIPACGGHCGHPLWLSADAFGAVLAFNGAGGLKGAINAAGLEREIIETADAGILPEGKFGAEYSALRNAHDTMRLRADFQVSISRETVFYDPLVHHLLTLTEEFGSLANACRHMGISYSKGRKIIAVMEAQLGASVLQTAQGGAAGGYSRLTDAAKAMMAQYSAFYAEAEQALQAVFKKHFAAE